MRLTVLRGSPDEPEARYETYDVPEYEGMTVLDALLWVREHEDPSLACRFACRSANACKECVAVVDGRQTYTCTSPGTGSVTVEPLPNKKHIRDLVVEM